MYGIYGNIGGGILMGSMLPYIAYMDPMGWEKLIPIGWLIGWLVTVTYPNVMGMVKIIAVAKKKTEKHVIVVQHHRISHSHSMIVNNSKYHGSSWTYCFFNLHPLSKYFGDSLSVAGWGGNLEYSRALVTRLESANWDELHIPASWQGVDDLTTRSLGTVYLVVLPISKNMKVNGTDDIPYIMEK